MQSFRLPPWALLNKRVYDVYILQSGNIDISVYFSNWYNTVDDKDLIQNFQLIMIRSQKPVEFSAGGMFNINVTCLVDVRYLNIYLEVSIKFKICVADVERFYIVLFPHETYGGLIDAFN